MKRRVLSLITSLALFVGIVPAALSYDMGKVGEYQTISAGYDHTAVIKDDGSLWTWGWNDYGQIGD